MTTGRNTCSWCWQVLNDSFRRDLICWTEEQMQDPASKMPLR